MPRKTAIERLSRLPRRYFVEWSDFRNSIGDDGDLFIWIEDGVEEYWSSTNTNTGGRKQSYSDLTIEFILTLKGLFGFPLRQTVEFLSACFLFTGVSSSIPDPSQVSRRARHSSLFPLVARSSENEPVHVFLRSDGVSVKTGSAHAPKDDDCCWCRAYMSIDRHGGKVLFGVVSVVEGEAFSGGASNLKSTELEFDRVESIDDGHAFLLDALNKGMQDALSHHDDRPFEALQSLSDTALDDRMAPLRKGLWKKETGIFAKPVLNVMVCRHASNV